MSIVTLSGLTGGGARRLGPGIARRLGADYVDRLILTDAARHAGATVAALHEREERPPTRGERFTGMLQRILERAAVSGAAGDPYFGAEHDVALDRRVRRASAADYHQRARDRGREVPRRAGAGHQRPRGDRQRRDRGTGQSRHPEGPADRRCVSEPSPTGRTGSQG